jgi:hypothetical protein
MGPFQGGIWDATSNPFGGGSGIGRRGGGGRYPTSQPQPNPYDDYESSLPMMEGMRGPSPMYGEMGGMGGPMTGGTSHSYSSYQDSDGNRHEEGYGPEGPFRNSVRGGMGPDMMGQGRPRPGSLLGGGSDRPGAFMSDFWQGPNPFRGGGGVNGRVNGRAGPSSGPDNTGTRDAAFRYEVDPAPMPPDRGLSQENSELMADFMAEQTQPLGGPVAPPNAECPICLELPSASHLCVQIKNIPGCNHLIGRDCLKEMLMNRPDDAKKCPICRAEFLGEDGIWQDSEQFQQLGGSSQGPPPGYGGGMPQMPAGYGGGAAQATPQTPRPAPRPAPPHYAGVPSTGPRPGPPAAPPRYSNPPRPAPQAAAPQASSHAAPPGLRNAMRGGARVHGMDDVGRGRGDEQDDDGGMQGGPPMMNDDRHPPEAPSSFAGRGQQLGWMDARQLW